MYLDGKILTAKSESGNEIFLLPKMANRHGLIAGATGTGKTITLKVLAESFSDMGVPVFFSDVKGDLSGMCESGIQTEAVAARLEGLGISDFPFQSYPTRFWDVFGEKGTPVRVTVSSLGPMLLAKLLNLTDAQTGVLNIVFKAADDNGLLLLDMKDLRAMLQYVGDNRKEYTTLYGNVSAASVGAIQRALLQFEQEDGLTMFGEPELNIKDWIRTDLNGRGFINILSSEQLIHSPTVYSTFLLWMLTELYEELPEVGDLDKPRMVFFFDEAHFLFSDAKKALVQKIEQVIKLIRSKGIGVYFVTQNMADIPDSVLAQLSNRIQHGLRAYTPSEMKSLRAAANAFRENASFDTEEALKNLGTGEALISFLDEKGIPSIVEKAAILPPQSLMGPAADNKLQQAINASEFDLKYREAVDRESAFEILERARALLEEEQEQARLEAEAQKQAEAEAKARAKEEAAREKEEAKRRAKEEAAAAAGVVVGAGAERQETLTEKKAREIKEKKTQSTASKVAQKAVTNATSSVARSVSTNIVNSLTGGKTASAQTIGKRAATSALSSVMRSGATSLVRGLFGNVKK